MMNDAHAQSQDSKASSRSVSSQSSSSQSAGLRSASLQSIDVVFDRPVSTATTAAVEHSLQLRRIRQVKQIAWMIAATVVLAVLAIVDICYGDHWYMLQDVIAVLHGEFIPGVSFIIGQLRLPRVIVAVCAGIVFGMAGCCFQTMLRNTLASPDIIGITAGANTAAVFGITVLGISGLPLSALAVAGGIGTAVLVLWLSWQGALRTGQLILMGIGIAAVATALTSWMLMRTNQWNIQQASRWLVGSVGDAQWSDVPIMLAAMILCGGILLTVQRKLDIMRLGDAMASMLGVRVNRVQALVLIVCVTMLSLATAVTGPIASVAFLAGPIAYAMLGHSRVMLIPAALVGSIVVVAADIVAQHTMAVQMPVGVITSMLGGPVLAILMVRMIRQQEVS